MKIIELVTILELDKDDSLPIRLLNGGQHPQNELSIYSTSQGICFFRDEKILSINNNNCSDMVYRIKTFLEKRVKEVNDNKRELDKYLAGSELLIAIDKYRGGEGNIDIEKAKEYVNTINRHIEDSLCFDDIIEMKELIEKIKKDKLYKELCFNVQEFCCKRADRFRGCIKHANRYCFGNKKYHEDLDLVHITIYDDCVELLHENEGRSYEYDLDNKVKHTLEQKIFFTLGCWQNIYKS